MVVEVRVVVTSWGKYDRKSPEDAGNVLYLDLGDGYMCVTYIYTHTKVHQAVHLGLAHLK